MMSVAYEPEELGFLLVTNDPVLKGMQKTDAYTLVMKRLEKRMWPLYEKTRLRERITTGVRVAFYVAGKREHTGTIVATATVSGRVSPSHGGIRTDPPEYLTDRPEIVLELENISILAPPVPLREFIPRLSFCPKDLKNWGSALQGGVRRLTDRDWTTLFPSTS